MKQETRNKKQGIRDMGYRDRKMSSPYPLSPITYPSRGFTLIEIIVALAIFSIVATVALGSLVKIISANQKAQTLQSAITNINFSLDSMSRELRVGSKFFCDSLGTYNHTHTNTLTNVNCDIGQNRSIFFYSSERSNTGSGCRLVRAYRFGQLGDNTWELKKASQNACTDNLSPETFTSILPSDVVITDFRLGVYQNNTDHLYPLAVIRLSGYVGAKEKERSYFDVQTAVSSRIP